MRKGCPYEPSKGKRLCPWHLLMKDPMPLQIEKAAARRDWNLMTGLKGNVVARMPKAAWPAGERWCAGCQSFVPLFYCSGSICKACASQKRHAKLLRDVYGMTPEDYQRLLEFQGGVCWVCERRPRKKRLAVDHDHATGAIRGLLCADSDRGCNHAVLGSLEGNSVDGPLAAARRLVEYLDYPPWQRLS